MSERSTERRRPGRPRVRTAPTSSGADHPTRLRLLEAALAVAARDGLVLATAQEVAGEAGVAKGTFYVHFATRDDLLIALHERWHDQAMAAIERPRHGLGPGAGRLAAGITGYLDLCRRQVGIRVFLLDARSEPTMRAAAAASLAEAADLIAGDLDVLGAPDPRTAARLVVAATLETALTELERGRRLPDLRAGLLWMITGGRLPGER